MHQHQRAQGTGAHAVPPAPADAVPAPPPTRQPAIEAEGAGTPATTTALRPVWHQVDAGASTPTAPAAPDVPADPAATASHPPAAAASDSPAAPSPHDVRAEARASLPAGRSASLWWVSSGLAVSVVVAWTVGAARGALVLAVLLAVCAVARAALPRGPVALTVRSRTLDTAVLLSLALGVGILSQVIPTVR